MGQGVAPLHLLTHEFTQILAAVTLPIAAVGTWWIHRRLPEGPDRSRHTLQLATAAAAGLGIAAFGAQLGSSTGYGCRTADASAFFWVTWPPVAALGIAVGLAARNRRRSRLALWLVGLVLASAAHDGLQYLNGVRIVDPILGDPLLFNQRIAMAVTPLHLGQRAWLTLGVITAVASILGGVRSALGPGIAFVLLTVGAGSHLGVGWSRYALRLHLDATHTTDHFVFLYPSAGRAAVHLDAIAQDAEWHYGRLTEAWGVRPDTRIEVRLYDTRRQLGQLTGRDWPHAGFYQIDIPLDRTHTSTLPHELVHALHAELSWNPRLIVNRAMTEGAAVAFSTPMASEAVAHAPLAAALAADGLPSAEVLFGPGGFHAVHEGNAYQAAGSFLGFLVIEHGVDRFVELQRALHPTGFAWRRVYGRDLPELAADWHAFLRSIPVGLADRAEARETFDPDLRPAYLSRTCPKLTDRQRPPQKRAEALWTFGDRRGATEVYLDLLDRTGRPRWAIAAAAGLDHLGDAPAAVDLLQAQLDRTDLDIDQRFALVAAQIAPLTDLGRFEAIGSAFAQMDALDDSPRPDDAAVAACLADPDTRDPARRLLAAGRLDGRAPMLSAIARHPDRDCLPYLMATRGVPLPEVGRRRSFTDREVRRIREVLRWIERAPAACDPVGPTLLSLGQAARTIDPALAGSVADALVTACSDPTLRIAGRALADRLE